MLQIPTFIFLCLVGSLVFVAGWVLMLTRSKNEVAEQLRISDFNNELKEGHISNLRDRILELTKIAEGYQNTCDIHHRQITYQQQKIKEYENKIKAMGKR